MTLPEPLRSFWNAMLARHRIFEPAHWGAVVADPRYPGVWDANHAAVFEEASGLTAAAIRERLLPLLRAVGARHEHVEFWDVSDGTPALRQMREERGRDGAADVDMVFEGHPPPRAGAEIPIREIREPDDEFLEWYRGTRNEYGEKLSEEVLDQMLRRDLEVFLPAGLRWFVAYPDGRRAGFSALLSLEGVGYLDGVVTMPPFRRRGVATATVTAAVRASLEAGDELVHLLAEEGGAPQRLYERLGFRVRGRVESFTARLPH